MFLHAQRRGEQLVDLLPRENERQFLFQLRQLHLRTGIGASFFRARKKFVKGAQRRKLQPDVSCAPLFLSRDETDNRENRPLGISAMALVEAGSEFSKARSHTL